MHADDFPPPMAAAAPGASGIPWLAAADLHDHLMLAGHDLQRLQRLLDNASQVLMGHFAQASGHIDGGALTAAGRCVAQAVTALQFQDMASQLITHTTRRLRHCADRIASQVMADDDGDDSPVVIEAAPPRPNPVTQDEMHAGSVELF